MEQVCVIRAIQSRDVTFRDTEAKTTLIVLDTSGACTATMAVEVYDAAHERIASLYIGKGAPGEPRGTNS